MLSDAQNINFQKLIYDYYAENKRVFAWRDTDNPYYVIVSEIMLQQTQTFRVIDKFERFVQVLPTFEALAQAPFSVVLLLWKGLGYNRRARYLQQIAQKIVTEHAGILPRDVKILETFPGIGPATARSIATFAYNQPEVFIETNIRTVFLHHFFPNIKKVHDKKIIPLVQQTLDHKNPRQWYYALMDYGVKLKKEFKNPARRSAHHTIQSKFEGSERQIRGKILEILLRHGHVEIEDLAKLVDRDYELVEKLAHQLVSEQLIQHDGPIFFI